MVRSLEPERKASRTIGQDKKLIVKSRVVLRDDFVATKSPQDDTRFTIFLIKKDKRFLKKSFYSYFYAFYILKKDKKDKKKIKKR